MNKKIQSKGRIFLNNPPYYKSEDNNSKVIVYDTEITSSINEDVIELSCAFDVYKYAIILYPKPYPIFHGNISRDNEKVGDMNLTYYENKKGRTALIGTWTEDGEEYSCIIELAPYASKKK